MARASKKLSAVTVKNLSRPGRHADGDGLYLSIAPGGSKSWVFLWMKDKRRREMGLGAYPAVSLADARSKLEECRRTVAAGGDPLELRDAAKPMTFGDCADRFLESMESGWSNEKHAAQWRNTLSRKRDEAGELVKDGYCLSIIDKPVADLTTEHVLKVLTPIWGARAETASRLRGRIERVLDYARVNGWRTGENPALWRGHLKNALPSRKKLQRGHHAALEYKEVPAFIAQLRGLEATSARALEFLILNASRSGEVMLATWQEIDFDEAVWTIPAVRMKAAVVHRVPLAPRALEILRAAKEFSMSDYIFPGQKPGRPLSAMAFTMLMRRMKFDAYTPHGFRSSFRDWVGDETTFPREIAEAALAHRVGDETERAYRRSDALARRRRLMEAWASYCAGEKKIAHLRKVG